MYLAGNPSDWDIAASPLRGWVQKWSASTNAIKLVLPPAAVNTLSQADKFALSVLTSLVGVSAWTGAAPPCQAGGQSVAEILAIDRAPQAWAYRSADAAYPNAHWATGYDLLVRGDPQTTGKLLQQLSIEISAPADMKGKVHRFEFRNELDGLSDGFGKRLLAKLEAGLKADLIGGEGEIVRIAYHDRYLNAPLPTVSLLDFISALKTTYKNRWSVRAVELVVAPFPEAGAGFNSPTFVYHNWPTILARATAISAAFDYCGIDSELRSMDKRDAMHARLMEIETEDGHLTNIWFDQGFSYWQTQSAYRQGLRFPFNSSPEVQGRELAESKLELVGQLFPTYLFVEMTKQNSNLS